MELITTSGETVTTKGIRKENGSIQQYYDKIPIEEIVTASIPKESNSQTYMI